MQAVGSKRLAGAGIIALMGALMIDALAQEQSVKPGINENFVNPDVDRYVGMFESEGRAIYKFRNEVMDALELKPGMAVADIGAGTGFYSMMMADRVGPEGTVYSVDIAQNFLDHIAKRAEEFGHKNVKTVLCKEDSVELPESSIDAAFICDTYHHFEYPYKTMASLHKALRPGGRLMIVDFERIVGVTTPFSIEHVRCGKGTVTDEVKDAGFDFVREVDLMEDQYVIIFTRREPKSDE